MTTSRPDPAASHEARFRAVHEATYGDLLRFAQRRVHPAHAEDVAAETFLVAWRRVEDLPVELHDARPWLFGVARAVMLNHRRGERRREALAVRLGEGSAGVGPDDADAVAHRVDLQRAWPLLTPAEQEVVSLAVWEGLDSRQAGAVLGCSATAYRLRLSRARRSLRGHLGTPTRTTLPEGAPR